MARRKRDHIPLQERLAAALACLLPEQLRNDMRRLRVPAEEVLKRFTFDHVHLHSLGGPDLWWNLDPRRRGPELRAKDFDDTTRVAKVRRLEKEHEDFRKMLLKKKPGKAWQGKARHGLAWHGPARQRKARIWPKQSWPKKSHGGDQ